MHKSSEDCFYFLTSTCAKGALCTYRHSPLALASNVICPLWTRGSCLDPACPNRHTTPQRPMVGNGILCFYENTPMGCLKRECTFIHSRPRTHLRNTPAIRPSGINLINKDVPKPMVTNAPVPEPPQTTQVSKTDSNPTQPTLPNTAIESPPVVKSEIVTRRIAVPSNSEITTSSDNNSSPIKSTTRSVITDSKKDVQEEKPSTQSRIVLNRNVVVSETNNIPSRKIVQTTSTRVVVSSENVQSTKEKINDTDLTEQENNTKKFKTNAQSIIDIPFPCSTRTMINRLSCTSSQETTPVKNEAKPIRLNHDQLPANKTSNRNSSISVSKSISENKLSAGTELSQDEERRSMRLERFQKKPISPPRSVISSSSSSPATTTNNVSINTSSNKHKRTAPETILKTTPPAKRLATSSLTRENNGRKSADTLIAKNLPQKDSSPTTRPRFVPQPITAPSSQQTSSTRPSRLRQPPSVVIKQQLTPVTTRSQTMTKPIEQKSSNTSVKSTVEYSTSNSINEEDENQLLTLNEPTDIVDTFALIDEALLEADNLLELI